MFYFREGGKQSSVTVLTYIYIYMIWWHPLLLVYIHGWSLDRGVQMVKHFITQIIFRYILLENFFRQIIIRWKYSDFFTLIGTQIKIFRFLFRQIIFKWKYPNILSDRYSSDGNIQIFSETDNVQMKMCTQF